MRSMTWLSSLLLVASAAAFGACGDDGGGASGADAGAPDAGGVVNDVSPPKRSDIHGAMDPSTGTFAIFGGNDGPIVNQTPMANYRSDTWLFEQGLGWSEIDATGPSARGRQAVAYDTAAQRMLIFGGRFRTSGTTGNYTLYHDLWAFDFAARTWTMLSDGTGGPSPRYYAASAYDADSDTFYVYGGDTNPSALTINVSTEVWSFKDGAWTQMSVSGAAPDPNRLFVAYAYDSKRNRLLAYGGQVGDFVSAANKDLYALDLATGVWSKLHDGTGTAPAGRFSALMTYDADGDRYIVMGGHADPGETNDVWAFSPDAGTWEELHAGDSFTGAALGCLGNPRELPKNYVNEDLSAPERRSGGFLGYASGSLWLFGGVTDCSDHLDDTWQFDLAAKTWNEVREATSAESCARQNNDCQCLCL